MARIQYEDKVKVRNSNLPAKNTVRDVDLNEIKESVNALYDTVDSVESDLSSKENTANKQNSLTADGSGVKFPTVDAVNAALASISTDITIGATNILSGTSGTLLRNEGGVVGDTDYTVPKTDGTANQVLQTNGAGVVTWQTLATGITIGTTPITSGVAGRVLFEGAGNVVQEDSALFWDNTNKRLGVGATPSSSVRLDVRAQGALSTDIAFRVRNSANSGNFLEINGNGTFILGEASLTRAFQYISDGRLFMAETSGNFIELNPSTTNNRLFGGNHGWEISTSSLTKVIESRTPSTALMLYGGTLQLATGLNASDGTNVMSITNGIAPTANYGDSFRFYSKDIVAGNAAPHFRTENGAIVKIYQETTGVGASTLTGGGGTALTDSDTFDGYTLKQIVKALRNQGLLA